jgi:peptidoglycan-associated lipoprotein
VASCKHKTQFATPAPLYWPLSRRLASGTALAQLNRKASYKEAPMRSIYIMLALALVCSGTACKKKTKEIKTPVATQTTPPTQDEDRRNPNQNDTTKTNNTTTDDNPRTTASNFGPIFFSYDSPELNSEARAALDQIAEYLEQNPSIQLLISGHADERGTEEYNLSLGEDRAKVAKDYLLRWKIPASRIKTISFGEEKPILQGDEENSWSQNRRDEFEFIQ